MTPWEVHIKEEDSAALLCELLVKKSTKQTSRLAIKQSVAEQELMLKQTVRDAFNFYPNILDRSCKYYA